MDDALLIRYKDVLSDSVFHSLPDELILNIAHFNVAWAQNIIITHMKYYIKKSVKQKITFIDDMTLFAGKYSALGYGMKNYSLFYKNRIIKKKDALQILNLCNCCDRHMQGRPKTLAPWVELPFSSRRQTSCTCPCRHIARHLCRSC